MVAKRIWYKV